MNSGEVALALRLLPGQQLVQAHQLPLQLGEDLCHPGRKDLLATSDCTSLASSPSSSGVPVGIQNFPPAALEDPGLDLVLACCGLPSC